MVDIVNLSVLKYKCKISNLDNILSHASESPPDKPFQVLREKTGEMVPPEKPNSQGG